MTPDQLSAIRQRLRSLDGDISPLHATAAWYKQDIPALLAHVATLSAELERYKAERDVLEADKRLECEIESMTPEEVSQQCQQFGFDSDMVALRAKLLITESHNQSLSNELERCRAALENLHPNIKCYLYNNSHSAVPRIALESWINIIAAALCAPTAPAAGEGEG